MSSDSSSAAAAAVPSKWQPRTGGAEIAASVDLSGKTALVTGGSSGLGYETVKLLASRGARVFFTVRDVEKGHHVAEQIRSEVGRDKQITVMACDFGSLAGVRFFAHEFMHCDQLHQLDILVCNAGVMAPEYGKTMDGYELQWQTNHLAHFLLCNLLVPKLAAGAPSRVVVVGALAHKWGGIQWDDVNWSDGKTYDKMKAYAASKTANHLFSYQFNKLYSSKGIYCNSLHPGVIATELQRHFSLEDKKRLHLIKEDGSPADWLKTQDQGVSTQIWAAVAPELEKKGGLYLEDNHVAAVNDDVANMSGYFSSLMDDKQAERLWQLSCDQTKWKPEEQA